jgi:CO dehydrogenase/acetyl-CoA synthase epsilon subunit
MTLTPDEAAKFLKEEKKKLLLAGSLCPTLEVGGKKLLDYVVEIAKLTDTPIAATGSTMFNLKDNQEIKAKKMMAADLVNFLRAEKWEEPITAERPELLVLFGYYPDIARMLISTVRSGKTMILDNRYMDGATYSAPDLSFTEWAEFLNKLIDNLKK